MARALAGESGRGSGEEDRAFATANLELHDRAVGSSHHIKSDSDVEAAEGPRIPLSEFPPLPSRGAGYFTEPLAGVSVVTGLSALLVGITEVVGRNAQGQTILNMDVHTLTASCIWTEAGLAFLCTGYLIFAGAGVIRRSERTCYPMPAEVEVCLRESRVINGMKNVPGPRGSMQLGSYCTRCLVWRPPNQKSKYHHCQVCQRCVSGFDHHCGVFGRCIVRNNMPCFMALISMVFFGMVTCMVAVSVSSTPSHG